MLDRDKFRNWCRNWSVFMGISGSVSGANQMSVYGFAWWKVWTIFVGLACMIAIGCICIWVFLYAQSWWKLRNQRS